MKKTMISNLKDPRVKGETEDLEQPDSVPGAKSIAEPKLEKGDLAAILIAAFFNFILPIVLVCAAICLIAYFVLIR